MTWELRNWFFLDADEFGFVTKLANPPIAPEQLKRGRLVGEVYFRPLYNNGAVLGTTRLVGLKEGDQVVTQNSTYRLCDPDPSYEALFPDAKARLLKSLPRLD